jgi:transposase InsO family protein
MQTGKNEILSVETMCRLMSVSVSGYRSFVKRQSQEPLERRNALSDNVVSIFTKSRKTYGTRRVQAALRDQGQNVGRHRLRRVMRDLGLISRPKRTHHKTTDSNHTYPVPQNLLNQNFKTDKPNQVWVTDITFLRTLEGWLYLVVILDLFSRKVVGYSMSETIDKELVKKALRMAFTARGPVPGLIHHSDRGSQYASHDYQNMLRESHIICSMSRRGNCYDNSVAESFNKTLKVELIEQIPLTDRATLRTIVFEYIEVFYNRQRLHSYLNYQSPDAFELNYAKQKIAA